MFKYFAGSRVAFHFKTPALLIGLFYPAVKDGMKDNLVDFFGGNLLGDARSNKKRNVVVEFREMGGKEFEEDLSRFTHCTTPSSLLLGNGVNTKRNPSKPSLMNFKCVFFVPVFSLSSSSNIGVLTHVIEYVDNLSFLPPM